MMSRFGSKINFTERKQSLLRSERNLCSMKIRYTILAAAMAAAIAVIPAVLPHSAMAAGKQKAKKKLINYLADFR